MTYRQELDVRNKFKIWEIVDELPAFTKDYFNFCIVTRDYSSNTILNYATDIRLFFRYLVNANPQISSIKEITLDYLDSLSPLDIQEFLTVMDAYDADELYKNTGKEQENTDSTDFTNYVESQGFFNKPIKPSASSVTTNSSAGKARKIAAIRNFYKYFYNMKMIQTNPSSIITVSNSKAKRNPVIKLERYESNLLLEKMETDTALSGHAQAYAKHTYLRDIAIMYLFLGTGIRVSELVGIDLSDLNYKEQSVLVMRKGGFKEEVYYNEIVMEKIKEYISLERPEYALPDEKALFLSTQKKRITVRSVERLVKKYASQAVPNKKITPHKLRSTYGTLLYRETKDSLLVADALGHKSLSSVQKYVDVGVQNRKDAAELSANWTDV